MSTVQNLIRRGRRVPVIAAAVCSICFALSEPPAFASQQVFPSTAAAAKALIEAAQKDDINALESILGSDAKEVISSGDPVADNNARDNLVAKYNQMHRVAYDDHGRVILYIGADNWPLPIPMIKQGDGWAFDTKSGKEELLYRRIGRNELYTIDVLRDLADAQREYASESRDGDVKQFAQKIIGDSGKHDGLYWPVSAGEPESPIGPLIADASEEGYRRGSTGTPIPFHGYYYRVLTRQGKNAPGGAMNYIDHGKMTKGFAFLAYPAAYRASGVMTFMINQDGVVVQKDLGPETPKLAKEIPEFNPDKTWDQNFD